jgi:predicted lipid-binding transport protein (Tim44 family)
LDHLETGSKMQDTFDVTTIIFLALAVFVIWRLRSVLGQKTGREQPPLDPFVRREAQDTRPAPTPVDNVVRLPTTGGDRATVATAPVADRWAGVAEPQSPLARGLDSIVAVEPGFDPRGFAEGAKGAYEMIVMAFAQGDRKTLKGLLSREVFEGFDAAIAERDRRGEKVETTFVSLDRAEILAADVRNGVAQVTVRFVSKLITATRNAQGAVIDGSAETVVDVTDVWTFARTLGSADPNWQLVATEAAGQ